MNSLSRMLDVLNLFTPSQPVIDIEVVCSQLGYAPASAYRYVRELARVGLLVRLPRGYALGPRVIKLKGWTEDQALKLKAEWSATVPHVRLRSSGIPRAPEAYCLPLVVIVTVAGLPLTAAPRDPRHSSSAEPRVAGALEHPLFSAPSLAAIFGGTLVRGQRVDCCRNDRSVLHRELRGEVDVAKTLGLWVFLKQLVYLHVDMPADATRGGLLYSIAMAADKALGTAYAKNLQKRRTIEERLVDVLHLLMIHRCGISA